MRRQAYADDRVVMAGLDDALARIANDPAWADAVRIQPQEALRGYDLDPQELGRLEHALGINPGPPAAIFQAPIAGASPAPFAAAPAAGSPAASSGVTMAATAIGVGRFPLVVAGLAVASAAIGVGVGSSGALGSPTGPALRADSATVYGCSDDTTRGPAVATLHRGDRVWVIGRSGSSWLVIRHPERLTTPAWISTASVVNSADPATLPELTCSTASAVAAVGPTAIPTGATSTTSPTAVPTETPANSATSPATTTVTTTATTRSSTTTTRPPGSSSSTSSTSSSSSSTPPPDTTGPSLTLTSDSSSLYSDGGAACAAYRQQVTAAVTATDPSGATVDGVTWKAGTLTGSATKVSPGSYRIGPIYSSHSGTIPMTITVTAHDGKGNSSTRSTTVDFRQIAETCIG